MTEIFTQSNIQPGIIYECCWNYNAFKVGPYWHSLASNLSVWLPNIFTGPLQTNLNWNFQVIKHIFRFCIDCRNKESRFNLKFWKLEMETSKKIKLGHSNLNCCSKCPTLPEFLKTNKKNYKYFHSKFLFRTFIL